MVLAPDASQRQRFAAVRRGDEERRTELRAVLQRRSRRLDPERSSELVAAFCVLRQQHPPLEAIPYALMLIVRRRGW